jgi:hypothetical protein
MILALALALAPRKGCEAMAPLARPAIAAALE